MNDDCGLALNNEWHENSQSRKVNEIPIAHESALLYSSDRDHAGIPSVNIWHTVSEQLARGITLLE